MKPHLLKNRVFKAIARCVGVTGLFLLGWKLEGRPPEENKYIIIGAPHTSNWDFVFFLLLIFALGLPCRWMAKNTMFIHPFCNLLFRLGGIPIDRSRRNNVVAQTADTFRQADELMLAIAPSGTRSKVKKWKTGFYHMAHQAGIPILLGFIDYQKKIVGLGPLFHPTGQQETDIPRIQSYYLDRIGKA